jgi:hypothetical protein
MCFVCGDSNAGATFVSSNSLGGRGGLYFVVVVVYDGCVAMARSVSRTAA